MDHIDDEHQLCSCLHTPETHYKCEDHPACQRYKRWHCKGTRCNCTEDPTANLMPIVPERLRRPRKLVSRQKAYEIVRQANYFIVDDKTYITNGGIWMDWCSECGKRRLHAFCRELATGNSSSICLTCKINTTYYRPSPMTLWYAQRAMTIHGAQKIVRSIIPLGKRRAA